MTSIQWLPLCLALLWAGIASPPVVAATEQGEAGAPLALRRLYADGLTVPRESAEAMVWYRRAAEQGNAAAQYQLGVIYFFGEGVRPDRVSAYMWFHLAGANGYAAGVPWRDRVARDMSPEQIAAAQRLAREWVEAHRAGGK